MTDAFIAVLNSSGTALVYSTYWGGRNADASYAVAVDSAQNAYLGGGTCSSDFPTVAPFQSSPLGCTSSFVIKLNASGKPVYSWTEKVLYTFTGGTDGADPDRLIFDSQGNLYGSARGGGNGPRCTQPPGCGLVFRLSPPSSGTGPWTETVLYTFTDGSDGGVPAGGVIFDSSGNLYGTAAYGGTTNNGVVFELIPSS